jgi:hypothetical protein
MYLSFDKERLFVKDSEPQILEEARLIIPRLGN